MTWMGYDTETKEVFEFAVEDEDILQECARDYFPGTIYFEAEREFLLATPEGDMNWVEELFHAVILLRQFGEGLTPMTWREVETKMETYLRRADTDESFFDGTGKMEQAFPDALRQPKVRATHRWTEPAVTVKAPLSDG